MNRSAVLLGVFGLVILIAAADVAWLYPQLPERVATKFGGGGQPVAWSTRTGFLTAHLVSFSLTALLMLGLRFALPWIPVSMINLPHREYWLAPERAGYTRQRVGDMILGLGSSLLAFLTALGHLIMRANLDPEPRLGPAFPVLLGVYVAAMLGFVVWMFLRFRKPR
jgi:uncharacterized membrane protein